MKKEKLIELLSRLKEQQKENARYYEFCDNLEMQFRMLGKASAYDVVLCLLTNEDDFNDYCKAFGIED